MFNRSIKKMVTFSLLIIFTIGCGDDNPVEPEEQHFEAIGLYMIANGDTIVSYVDGIVSGTIEVTKGAQTTLLNIKYIAEDGDVGVPPSDEWSFGWTVADNSVAEVVASSEEQLQYQFRIEGMKEGLTGITILLNHHDHKDFESKEIPITVVAAIP